MADRKLAGEADQQVQRGDQHPVNADHGRDMQVVEVAGEEGQQPAKTAKAPTRAGRDGYASYVAHAWVPNSPCGRTTSRQDSRPMAMVF